jgi:hypothetical protein
VVSSHVRMVIGSSSPSLMPTHWRHLAGPPQSGQRIADSLMEFPRGPDVAGPGHCWVDSDRGRGELVGRCCVHFLAHSGVVSLAVPVGARADGHQMRSGF